MRRLLMMLALALLPGMGWAQASLGRGGIGYGRTLSGIGPCTTTSCTFTAPILSIAADN